MGRLFVIGGLLIAAYMVLNDNGSIRISGGPGGGGGGGFSTYSGASAPAISGIANAAGG